MTQPAVHPEPLAARRCHHHPAREAVARCPGCSRFFCRECVSEHDGLTICASCLAAASPTPTRRPPRLLARAGTLLAATASFAAAWFFFYLAGRLLTKIPDRFHEGTIWSSAE